MAKIKSIYVCQKCSYESAKWAGQCSECLSWNTFEEVAVTAKTSGISAGSLSKSGASSFNNGQTAKTFYLSDVASKEIKRSSSGISEFDRVLGGGFVKGQVILIAGEPGIGKSTLLTQLSKSVKGTVCYIAGEESPQQIKLRADRLKYKPKNMLVLSDTVAETIANTLEQIVAQTKKEKRDLELIIIDSIQTLVSVQLSGIAGSVGQVKLCSQILSTTAKKLGIPMILVGHVTKEGTVAGPKVLEHMVDTVLYLEGDSQHMYRILKTTKNRFGAVSEVGIFEMKDSGLIEVKNPSKTFLSADLSGKKVSGSCTTVIMEGYRPLLFEIQALTTQTNFGYPRRTASGFNANRLAVLIAILEKRAGLNLSNHDVYINVAGGFKVNEYAADLAVCLAIASSLTNKPVKNGVVAFGECGLLGEIRNVSGVANRTKEAKKLGYDNVISPKSVKFVSQAIKKAL